MALIRRFTLGGVFVLGLSACPPSSPTGQLEILFDSSPYFSTETGGQAGFRQADLLLGPLASFNSGRVQVHYDDNHSTFASQDEIIVMARDPDEYLNALETMGGADYGTWYAETFAPGDPGPNYTSPCPFCNVTGITLPAAQSFAYPDVASGTPTAQWVLTQAMFSGSPTEGFDLAAGGNGGSTKGITLLHRGVCSREQNLQNVVNSFISAVPEDESIAGDLAELYLPNVEAASFISRDNLATPNGGLVIGIDAYMYWNILLGASSSAIMNETYFFSLNDGILTMTPQSNLFSYSGVDPFGAGSGHLQDYLAITVPQTTFLQALAAQSQPIPSAVFAAGGCSLGSGNQNPNCFMPCDLSSLGDPTSNDPSKWPKPLDANDWDMSFQEESWYNTDFCATAANVASAAVAVSAASIGITGTDLTTVTSPMTATRTSNPDLSKNVRCNFYPKYEKGTVKTSKNDASGNPILTGVPVCELVVRGKRVNTLPDNVELVFFDGPDLQHIGSEEFGNEAFSAFLALNNFAPSAVSQMCNRQPESSPATRLFAHARTSY